ncbi:hypothetical protein HPB52_005214 [Rhipicephalus sanguineus]|uniref:Uncharacterized protein n=1 Tax=Rhipicephalus sanguineus TaxID=34632 RepID=A0A9D4STP9_RHISA|nr:hypothetical protein HPB52_005214 [Rhipicephalus sanguineus]
MKQREAALELGLSRPRSAYGAVGTSEGSPEPPHERIGIIVRRVHDLRVLDHPVGVLGILRRIVERRPAGGSLRRRQRPHLPDPSKSRLASFPFQYAAFIGHASRSGRTCSETYGRCRLRPGELIEMYAARGQPRLRVQGSSAALTVLPASFTRDAPKPSVDGQRGIAQKDAPNAALLSPQYVLNTGSSGYDLLKKMLKDVLVGRKSFKRPSAPAEDESRALITIQFSGR